MALQLSTPVTTGNGLSFSNGYVNIQHMSYHKNNGKLEVMVNIYKDKAARDDKKAPVMRKFHRYEVSVADLDGKYLYALSYDKLKENEYAGATNV
jgi:hypothetical protein